MREIGGINLKKLQKIRKEKTDKFGILTQRDISDDGRRIGNRSINDYSGRKVRNH